MIEFLIISSIVFNLFLTNYLAKKDYEPHLSGLYLIFSFMSIVGTLLILIFYSKKP